MPVTPDFNTRLAKITARNKKVVHKPNTTWPQAKRLEVVSQWLVVGNLRIVAGMTGVSYELVRDWKKQPWWKEMEAELRQTQNIEMDTKLSKIVDKSLDATLDRLENGEAYIDNKTGDIKRRPVALRDAARVSVDILSKRELLRGNATERKESTQIPIADQLALLAAEFAKWQKKPETEVIDVEMVEVIDAVHDEWEEGLQEGGGEIHLETSGSEETSGAERSPSGDGESGSSPQR